MPDVSRFHTALAVVLLLAGCSGSGSGKNEKADVSPDTVARIDISSAPDVPADVQAEKDVAPEVVIPSEVIPESPDNWISATGLAPRNVHTTFRHDAWNSGVVTWAVDHKVASIYKPRLWFASQHDVTDDGVGFTFPYSESRVVEGTCREYQEELVGIPISDTKHLVCEAEMNGLEPYTRYYYRAGMWEGFDFVTRRFEEPNLSDVGSFRTGMPKGSRDKFVFISAGDTRGGYGGLTANSVVYANIGADFWLFNGDMNDTGTQAEWEMWFNAMEPVNMTSVLMPVIGNHELIANVFFEQFSLPEEEDLPHGYLKHAWAFNYGNVHFLGMNSNTELAVIAQIPWLTADLEKASSDPDIDWIIVMHHHAVYSSSNHGSTLYVQEHWVPIFEKYGVDLVFNGHDHDYERTKPIWQGEVNQDKGLTYVVVGAFFAPAYSASSDWWTEVSHDGDVGNYSVVEVDGTNLHVIVYSGDGTQILDQFSFSK